jgi:hypothetical protein
MSRLQHRIQRLEKRLPASIDLNKLSMAELDCMALNILEKYRDAEGVIWLTKPENEGERQIYMQTVELLLKYAIPVVSSTCFPQGIR